MRPLFLMISLIAICLCSDGRAQLSPNQHDHLVNFSRWLASERIGYNQRWRLPGEKDPWVMDCSNTVRYIYQRAFNVELPRTASSQYWVLAQEGLITKASYLPNGSVDANKLFSELRSGDLLFWEWTYDIKRTPPITHVMIYLGKTADGEPRMVGSATRSRGEITQRGGVDVYRFNPNAPMGGVRDSRGNFIRVARFVGFGRPVQRDESIYYMAVRPDQQTPGG